jgi:hypothetical protein
MHDDFLKIVLFIVKIIKINFSKSRVPYKAYL